MTDQPTELLRVEGLKKHFFEDDGFIARLRPGHQKRIVRAVDGVDLAVDSGSTVGLVGESGCGKSTLAETLLHLIEPTEGEVYFRGTNVTEFNDTQIRAFRSEAQMIFQDPFSSLNPRHTIRRTLTDPMELHGIGDSRTERSQRAENLIEDVGLAKEHLDRYPHEFSGGQRQRIAIARALSVEPSLLVADEPVSALDVSFQAQILNLLRRLRSEFDLTILFISHDLSVVRQICDRVAVMYLGEIVEKARTKTLFENPQHPYSEVLVSSIPTPDPTAEYERTKLEGDVPTPVDPPSGCRFHPRCPKVIPPADWEGTQDAFRRVVRLRNRIDDGTIQPQAVRDQLQNHEAAGVTDEDVVDALYREHITEDARAGIRSSTNIVLPDDTADLVRDALSKVVAGDLEQGRRLLAKRFSSVCEIEEPVWETANDHEVYCHLHGSDRQPAPRQPTGSKGS